MDNSQPLTDMVDLVVDGIWIVTLRWAASLGMTLKDPLDQTKRLTNLQKTPTLTYDNC